MALHLSLLTSPAIPETGPDAALIAACNAFAAIEIRRHDPECDLDDPDICHAHDVGYERLFDAKATTPAGFKARARAAALYLSPDQAGEWHWQQVEALLRDMLGLPDPDPDPDPEAQGESAAPLPPDPADPSPHGLARPWREMHPLWVGPPPEPAEWVEQAHADLLLIRLCVAFQAKPMAEIEEGFRTDPDAMTKTSAALSAMTTRYENLVRLMRGEAMRYGIAGYRAGLVKL